MNFYNMHMDELYTISLNNNTANKIYKKRLAEIRRHIHYQEEDNGCNILFNGNKNGIHCVYHNDYYKTKQMGV